MSPPQLQPHLEGLRLLEDKHDSNAKFLWAPSLYFFLRLKKMLGRRKNVSS
jgi:hypothetical protein